MSLVKIKISNDNIYLSFPYDKKTINYIKTFEDRKWLKELNLWSIPYFDNYLETFKNNRYGIEFIEVNEESIKNKDFQKFIQLMKIKNVNNKSFKIYSNKIETFLLNNIDYSDLDEEKLYHYIGKTDENVNSKNQLINALKLFYLYVFNKKIKIENIKK